MASKKDSKIIYHAIDINKEFLDQPGAKRWSPTIANRFYLAELLPNVNKILFLDVDIILTGGNVRELYDINMEGYAIAGCHYDYMDTRRSDAGSYGRDDEGRGWLDTWISAGVVLFNLSYIRQNHDMVAEAKEYCRLYQDGNSFDEYCMNYMFHDCTKIINRRFNYIVSGFDFDNEPEIAKQGLLCIHYVDMCKPLMQCNGAVDYYFWHYFLQTPYCTTEYMKRYFDFIGQMRCAQDYVCEFYRQWRLKGQLVIWGAGAFTASILRYIGGSDKVGYLLDNYPNGRKVMNDLQIYQPQEMPPSKDVVTLLAVHHEHTVAELRE